MNPDVGLGAAADEPTEPAAPSDEVARDGLAAIRIGRYQLLELVGTGGMGIVWGAWDPELERRVALKLLQPTMAAARDRLLREGQLLARMSHPNVVPIYDVGVVGEQVYLVMEWVRGTTLRAFAAEAPGRDALVDAYRQAGAGLAAVHRAGVIHRDFKPDNAIRGDDGRVRVLDFGLAGAQGLDRAGTPRYMAPEQQRGDPLTTAVDQYAFCVALGEALGGGAPARLAAIVARGSAATAEARFPSMDALLAAIAHDPIRRWRWPALGLALIAAAALAFGLGRTRAPGATAAVVEPCSGAAAELAERWDRDARDRLTSHLAALGPLDAGDVASLAATLDDYGATWTVEQRRGCLAHERRELTQPLYDRRLRCLGGARASLGAAAEVLTTVDAAGLAQALVAARSLPDPRGCAALDASTVAPPAAAIAGAVDDISARLARARVLVAARRAGALDELATANADAAATGYPPLIARALYERGKAEQALVMPDAAATFDRAWRIALAGSDDPLAVEAYARWLFVGARNGRTDPPNLDAIAAIAARLGPEGEVARSWLDENVGLLYMWADRTDEARPYLIKAMAEAGGEAAVDTARLPFLRNMMLVTSDPRERAALVARISARSEALLGPNHPGALASRTMEGMYGDDRRAARAILEETCPRYWRWPAEELAPSCAFELAMVVDELGDGDPRPWIARAANAHDPRRAPVVDAFLAVLEPSPRDGVLPAVRAMEALGAKLEHDQEFWERGTGLEAWMVAARGWDRLGRARDAERAWTRAAAIGDTLESHPAYDRRVNRARVRVALRLASTRPDEARRLAALVIARYHGVDDYRAELAQLAPIAAAPP